VLRSEAESLVAVIQAYFPRPELPNPTVAAWAGEFEPFDFEAAQEAVRWYCTTHEYPRLSGILEAIHETESRRREAERGPARYELPPADEATGPTAEFMAAVHRISDAWAEKRDHRAEDARWRTYVEGVKSGPRMRGLCSGVGKKVVVRDGKAMCPDCGEEL
jgi:hypothetical protein